MKTRRFFTYSKTPRNSRSKGFYYMIRGKMMSFFTFCGELPLNLCFYYNMRK